MNWFYYISPLNSERLVIKQNNDGTTTSGVETSCPEYLAWVAEGNEPEPWQPPVTDNE